MSASTLHYAHGVRGVKYKSTQFVDGKVIIHAILDQTREVCPLCKGAHLNFKDIFTRHLQMCPTGKKPCWLYLTMCRRLCLDCHHKWRPHLPFVPGQRRMVRSFENYIIRQSVNKIGRMQIN